MGYSKLEDTVLRRTDLSAGGKLLWGVLSSHCRGKKTECYPGQKKLAERCGVSTRTIKRWTAELVEAGMVKVKRRRSRSAVYTLLIGDIPVTPQSDENPTSVGDTSGTSEGDIPVTSVGDTNSHKRGHIRSQEVTHPAHPYIDGNTTSTVPLTTTPKATGVVGTEIEKAEKEKAAERLRDHGVYEGLISNILVNNDADTINAYCDRYEELLAAGENVGPGILGQGLKVGCMPEPPTKQKAKKGLTADTRNPRQYDPDAPEKTHEARCPECHYTYEVENGTTAQCRGCKKYGMDVELVPTRQATAGVKT